MTVACAMVPSPEHTQREHPENAARFKYLTRLRETAFPGAVTWLETTPAGPEEILMVHTPQQVDFLRSACQQAPTTIDPAPTYVTSASLDAALAAAGAALACARAVVHGQADSAFALVRPPGHHAEPDRSMGFCLFNNLSLAVRAALQEGVERVLIVDYDAHHGNGTQRAFWSEERVAFVSTHQERLYPGSGLMEEAPHARGRIVNLPLPLYAGDRRFEQIAEQVYLPLAQRFRPQMIFVSAGFDAHWEDPLTSLGLSTRGFFHINQHLVSLAGQVCAGKIVFILEGGYEPYALMENAQSVLSALTGAAETPDSSGPSPYPEPNANERLASLRELHGF